MTRRLAPIVFILVSLVSPTAAIAAERIGLAALVDAFDQAILQGQGRISKWPLDRPLTLKAGVRVGATERAALDNAAAFVVRRSGLVLRRDDGAAQPDIVVNTVDDLGIARAGTHNVGRTQTSFDTASGTIQSAEISLLRMRGGTDDVRLHRTAVHELLHAVGFHGHPPSGFESVMSLPGAAHDASDWDSAFLTVLYDTRLPVGTPRVFALPIVCRLLNEHLLAERTARVADLQSVGDHPLCAMLAPTTVTAATADERVALAWAYYAGAGVARNLDEAERWARLSKSMGDADADYLLYLIETAKLPR